MTGARIARTLLAIAGWVFLSVAPTPAQQPALPDSVQGMIAELQGIQQELGAIQSRTLEENPALLERQESIQQNVEAAMIEMDPEVERSIARLDSLRTELEEAQGAEDLPKLQALLMEGQQLQQHLQSAQAAALERDDIARQVDTYREELLDKMKEVDPKTEQLIARLEQLAMRLEATMPQP